MRHDVRAEMQLVSELRSQGGVNKSISELLHIDRDQLSKFTAESSSILKRFNNFGRYNEAIFAGNEIKMYKYSGVMESMSSVSLAINDDNECHQENDEIARVDDNVFDEEAYLDSLHAFDAKNDQVLFDVNCEESSDSEIEDNYKLYGSNASLVIGSITGCKILDIAEMKYRPKLKSVKKENKNSCS